MIVPLAIRTVLFIYVEQPATVIVPHGLHRDVGECRRLADRESAGHDLNSPAAGGRRPRPGRLRDRPAHAGFPLPGDAGAGHRDLSDAGYDYTIMWTVDSFGWNKLPAAGIVDRVTDADAPVRIERDGGQELRPDGSGHCAARRCPFRCPRDPRRC